LEITVALVLCTGTDAALLQTRKLILERAGHTVISVMDEREMAAACREYVFDLAVIGEAVSPRMKRAVASSIRAQCRSVRILELYQQHQGKILEDADSWMEVPAEVPTELAEHVNELVAKKPRRASG
jgi:hypothetical protein